MTVAAGAVLALAARPKRPGIGRAWLLALAPLLFLGVETALLFIGSAAAVVAGLVAGIVVNTVVAVWDSRQLASGGHGVSIWLALFAVPVYLFRRSRTLVTSQAALVGWVVAVIVAAAGSAVLDSHFVYLDMSRIEAGITQDLHAQGDRKAVVSCPKMSVYAVHERFYCDVVSTDASASVAVRVLVVSSRGDVTW